MFTTGFVEFFLRFFWIVFNCTFFTLLKAHTVASLYIVQVMYPCF